MQENAARALKLLDYLVQSGRNGERIPELLREANYDGSADWAFCLPPHFNDALDIRQTSRRIDGKVVILWTQGAGFNFRPGDVIYDSPEGYLPWSEALSLLKRVLQVTGGNETRVEFDLLTPTKDRKSAVVTSSHSLSQQEFVRFLISGDLKGGA